MDVLALGAILLLRVFQSISGKRCSRQMPSDRNGIFAYLSVRMGLSAAAAFVVLLFEENAVERIFSMPALGWLLALGTGITLTVSTFCNLAAMKGSSLVLVQMFGAGGLLIPTIFGVFLYDQTVTIGQAAGIVCLFLATLLLASSSQKTNGKIHIRTLLLLLGLLVSNGGTMLLQTMYKNYVPQGSVSVYSLFQFLIPAGCLFAVCAFQTLRGSQHPIIGKSLLGWTAVASVSVFGISQISTIASAFIPAGVLFPVSDGGSTVISAVVAATLFKEKTTWQSVCGAIVGVTGLILIKLLAA